MSILLLIGFFALCLISLTQSYKPLHWELSSAVYLAFSYLAFDMHGFALTICTVTLSCAVAFFHVPLIKQVIGKFLYKKMKSVIPKLSATEEEALNAGNTWLEKSFFMGEPDWDKLYKIPAHALTHEEQHFIDNEVHELCRMCDEWEISQQKDLSPEIWQFLKDKGFFGLEIAKEYGGLGFSARAHSDIVMKIASQTCVGAVTVMVPNSLGPGELIGHYGTQEQKDKYLPALAKGLEIPCFALTEPTAGSDATSIYASAIVKKGKFNGKEILGLELTFNKRWITLAPVATLIGLAVNVEDPENLMTQGREGITCLLIPRTLKGLEIGNRHIPSNQYFMNGTIRGKDLFVPLDSIIGGESEAGAGWKMLVECLSIGRAISLPALGTAMGNVSYLSSSAYSKVRRQFNMEIGKFEGIEEKLAEIAGLSYLTSATRELTVAAVDEDLKPSVASAIAKYFNTENGRTSIINAMDIHGGKAVVNGPNNPLIEAYQSMPISITVEGANIMTRNLLLFGQGAMACHPFLKEEFYALSDEDETEFTSLLWQHATYFLTNFAKTVLSTLSGGYFIRSPKAFMKREHQKLTRLSYAFAWASDLCLMVLGGELKRKERLSARLGDALSHLYMAAAVLKNSQNNDNDAEKLHAKWALEHCFYNIQKALLDLSSNFPNKAIGILIRLFALPLGQTMKAPSDKLEHKLAALSMKNQSYREKLRHRTFLSGSENKSRLDKTETAFQLILDNEALFKRVKGIGKVSIEELDNFLAAKVTAGELSESQKASLLKSENARWQAIQVDEFPFSQFKSVKLTPEPQETSNA